MIATIMPPNALRARVMMPSTFAEREHLETAYHELCTALTIARSNVALARLRLVGSERPGAILVGAHLTEVDAAIDRLEEIAGGLRARHAGL